MDADADLMLRVARGRRTRFASSWNDSRDPRTISFCVWRAVRGRGGSHAGDVCSALSHGAEVSPEAAVQELLLPDRLESGLQPHEKGQGKGFIFHRRDDGERLRAGLGAHEDDPQAVFDARETRRRYEKALAELPRQWRIAIELRVARELSYEEIADAMGKSVAAVESILYRARERLPRRWTDRHREGG